MGIPKGEGRDRVSVESDDVAAVGCLVKTSGDRVARRRTEETREGTVLMAVTGTAMTLLRCGSVGSDLLHLLGCEPFTRVQGVGPSRADRPAVGEADESLVVLALGRSSSLRPRLRLFPQQQGLGQASRLSACLLRACDAAGLPWGAQGSFCQSRERCTWPGARGPPAPPSLWTHPGKHTLSCRSQRRSGFALPWPEVSLQDPILKTPGVLRRL